MIATPPPIIIDAARTRASLAFERLIPALRDAFKVGANVPLRHHHFIPRGDAAQATILIMPAWQQNYLGIKFVTIFPDNTTRNLPGLFSSYLLCDGETGQHLALIDGNEITSRRTVGVAALGASFLARKDAKTLLVAGTGRIGSLTAHAFSVVRSFEKISVWNIRRAGAERLVASLRDDGFNAHVADDLESAVKQADIVSCATLSNAPIIKGEWLRPGTHLDLIGSFTPFMREADDDVFRRGRVYLDTIDALKESGELLDPMRSGAFAADKVQGTLTQLCKGECEGRKSDDEITVFKAVGNALPDIASASLVYRDFLGKT